MSPVRTHPSDDQNPALADLFVKAASIPLLTVNQERALGEKAFAGDRVARNDLVLHNLRLAIHVAKDYRGKGMPFEDLVSEAIVGLHRAAEKFDPSKGFRFSTYASWWLKHFCQRAVQNKVADIRVPWQVQVRRAKILRYLDENPEATPEELAAIGECTPEQVYEATHVPRTATSLDQAMGGDDEEEGSYHLIADPTMPSPEEAAQFTDPGLADALACLTDDERRVVMLRFGFEGPVKSRKEIAKRLNTDERSVSRLQREAMRKLRASMSSVDGAGSDADGLSSTVPPSRDLTPICGTMKEPV